MSGQRLAAVLPLVQAEARLLGFEFDLKAPGAVDALRECLKAYRRAWADVAARDSGQAVETPLAPTESAASQSTPRKLRDVLAQWKASKVRKLQTEKAAELALALYEEATGNPDIRTLTQAQGNALNAKLVASGVSSKTARDRFDYVKGFLNFAARELELIPKNPWEGLAIEHSVTTPRRPWSTEQLVALFGTPLFTSYAVPTSWDSGADAAYWLPLLALFTGDRSGELCQLMVADFATVDGVAVLNITDEGEGQSVKTAAGRRTVPLHAELIRLGFLEYVAAIKATEEKRLFPSLRLAPTKPSNYFSSWFATMRPQPDGSKLPDFHSFRHTARSKLASVGVAEPMIDVLLGHEVKGSTGAKTARTTDDLKRAIDLLVFPGVALPRVFREPVRTVRKPRNYTRRAAT